MTLPWAAALVASLGLASCASKPARLAPQASVASQPPAATLDQNTIGEQSGVTPGSQEDLAATAGERVFFDFDSYALSDDARATLGRQAAWLSRYPARPVLIAGNADERGTREYNLALGARRAAAARDYLVGQGVSSGRLRTVSYGKERPIASGSDQEAWAQNRNAHTALAERGEQGR